MRTGTHALQNLCICGKRDLPSAASLSPTHTFNLIELARWFCYYKKHHKFLLFYYSLVYEMIVAEHGKFQELRQIQSKFNTIAALTLAILGLRIFLVGVYGNSVPWADEWDSAWGAALKPWLEGRLSLESLLSQHIEHRMLMSRLTSLILFILNGNEWSLPLEMGVSALLQAASFAIFATALTKEKQNPFTLPVCAVLFAIPFSYENLLFGLQTGLFFVVAFTFILLNHLNRPVDGPRSASISIFYALVCILSNASGFVSILIALLLLCLNYSKNQNYRSQKWTAILFFSLILIAVVMLLTTNRLESTRELQAKSIMNLFEAFTHFISFPFLPKLWIVNIAVFGLYCFSISKNWRDERFLFLMSVALWSITVAGLLSYTRAGMMSENRYFDLIMPFCAVLIVVCGDLSQASNPVMRISGFIVMFLLVLFVAIRVPIVNSQLEQWHVRHLKVEKNVIVYWQNGQFDPALPLAYPRQEQLEKYLSDPLLRKSLPPISVTNPDRFERSTLLYGFRLFGLGCILLAFMYFFLVLLEKTKASRRLKAL